MIQRNKVGNATLTQYQLALVTAEWIRRNPESTYTRQLLRSHTQEDILDILIQAVK